MNPFSTRDTSLALALQGVDKRYGVTRALNGATLEVRPGTVHALLGENGAGKSTLMRIAYGLEQPDAGSLTIHGETVRLAGAADAIARGVGMVHQHFTLVPGMTVAENVALGGRGLLDRRRVAARLADLSASTGFVLDPDTPVESLSVVAQQRVEIAKALTLEARLLVLDEPTAVLPPAESSTLLRWLRSYADQGNAVVLITHKLREALDVADDITVLRRGRTVLTVPGEQATAASLTDAMLGSNLDADRSVPHVSTRNSARSTGPVFRAEQVSLVDGRGVVRVRDASFTVDAGEIVGIAGIEGAGQHELLRALAGRLSPVSGRLDRPHDVGFVPEDRHRDAVLLDRPLMENVALRGAGVRRGLIDWKAFETRTEALLVALDVRAPGPRAVMRTLSGGNQQKLVLGRELDGDDGSSTRALVVENPTRGLDVRATVDVHARLRNARDRGAAVVLYSSDIDEVLLLANRVLVLYSGVVRESPVDRDVVGRLMLGVEVDGGH